MRLHRRATTQVAWNRCKAETVGRGFIAPEQGMVEEIQTQSDEELAEINERFSVRR